MDVQSFELLGGVAQSQLDRLRSVLSGIPEGRRGGTYTRFVAQHLDAIELVLGDAKSQYLPSSSDDEQEILGRTLQRLKIFLDDIHGDVFEYRRDIGRRDLPVGLLYLVDALVEDLLKAKADPIIHSDPRYMYSTIRVEDRWRPISTQLDVTWAEPAEPIVFNLPGLDPANAMLAPILAHEVGHSVIQRHDLVFQVWNLLPESEVSRLIVELSGSDPNSNADELLDQFGRWTEELLCDALATELSGPSMLFASAAFLPASSVGLFGADHPDPAHRLALTVLQLRNNGWEGCLSTRSGLLYDWLQSISVTGPPAGPPKDTFLTRLVDLALPAIVEVAHGYVERPFLFEHFAPVENETMALLQAGIPPAEVKGEPLSAWTIIAGVWFNGLRIHGGGPDSLAMVSRDVNLSRFALKSIEMARVLQLWKEA